VSSHSKKTLVMRECVNDLSTRDEGFLFLEPQRLNGALPVNRVWQERRRWEDMLRRSAPYWLYYLAVWAPIFATALHGSARLPNLSTIVITRVATPLRLDSNKKRSSAANTPDARSHLFWPKEMSGRDSKACIARHQSCAAAAYAYLTCIVSSKWKSHTEKSAESKRYAQRYLAPTAENWEKMTRNGEVGSFAHMRDALAEF